MRLLINWLKVRVLPGAPDLEMAALWAVIFAFAHDE